GALPTFNAGGGIWECGAPGADGRSVLSGAGAPSGALGSDGDFYIDTSAWAIYGPRMGGAWGAATSLQGPQGAEGPQGPQGSPGLDAGEQPYTGPWGLLVFSGNNSAGLNGSPPAVGFRVHRFEFPVDRPVDLAIGSGLTPADVRIGELTVW